MQARNEDKQTKAFPFGLPEDILFKNIFPLISSNKDCYSIDNTRALAMLSGTCSSMYRFFKPELNERLALLALACVLQGNEDAAIKLAKSHPKIFFIKSTAHDYAMDLEGIRRTLENWSPYQAMFGTGDVDMLKKVKPYLNIYLSTLANGKELADNQEQEKFPNGFKYPKSTYDFTPLVKAIINDKQLIETGKPSDATLSVLVTFRADFKPGLIKTGHHFNVNHYVKAHEAYGENLSQWNEHQLWFFGVYVIGFLQRLMPAPYMQRACHGVNYGINNEQPVNRIYNIIIRLHDLTTMKLEQDKQITVFPLDTDHLRLGNNFFISGNGTGLNYFPNPSALYYWRRWSEGGIWRNYLKQVERDFNNFSDKISDVATKAINKNNSLTCTENIQDGINFRRLGLFSIGAALAGIALVSGIKKFYSYRR